MIRVKKCVVIGVIAASIVVLAFAVVPRVRGSEKTDGSQSLNSSGVTVIVGDDEPDTPEIPELEEQGYISYNEFLNDHMDWLSDEEVEEMKTRIDQWTASGVTYDDGGYCSSYLLRDGEFIWGMYGVGADMNQGHYLLVRSFDGGKNWQVRRTEETCTGTHFDVWICVTRKMLFV